MNDHDRALTDVQPHHIIQRQIMMALRQRGELSYATLKPDGVEGNAFNYHLKLLRQSKLVESSNKLYRLTPTGQLVTDSFSFDRQRVLMRPYHYTYPLVTYGEYVLVYEVCRQPLMGRLALPAGKMHYGDDYRTSISRELARRNITSSDPATFLCAINLSYCRDGAVVMHRPGVVWHIRYTGERVVSETPSGRTMWITITDAMNDARSLPDVIESLRRLEDPSYGPIELCHAI